MATTISREVSERADLRRRATIEAALDHAEQIMSERGAGAVTISELARHLRMRPPSVYKYFPSLHGVYDALFARGNERLATYVDDAVRELDPGLDRLLGATRAIVKWSMLNKGIAPLLFWRPVPGFEPGPSSYAVARGLVERSREDLATAARSGQLGPEADSDDVFRLFTSVSAGLCSQQLANEPDADFESGKFTSLLEPALDMFVRQYSPPPRKARR